MIYYSENFLVLDIVQTNFRWNFVWTNIFQRWKCRSGKMFSLEKMDIIYFIMIKTYTLHVYVKCKKKFRFISNVENNIWGSPWPQILFSISQGMVRNMALIVSNTDRHDESIWVPFLPIGHGILKIPPNVSQSKYQSKYYN